MAETGPVAAPATPNADRADRAAASLLAQHAKNQPTGEDHLRFTLACRLRDLGLTQERASELLHYWNDELVTYSRDASEIDKAIGNAWTYARDDEGNEALPPPASEAFAAFIKAAPPEEPPATVQEAANRVAKSHGLAVQFASLEEAEGAPEPDWLVPGMIPAEGLTLMFGPPKRGKTFAAMDLALSLAAGRPWLNCVPLLATGPVVYLALEGIGAFLERSRAWQQQYGKVRPGSFFVAKGMLQAGDASGVEGVILAIEALAVRPAAIFIDTVARAGIGLDENSAKDMGVLAAHLEAIGQHFSAPVIGIHHSAKADAGTLRGSGALMAAVEAAIEVSIENRILTLTLRELRRGESGKVVTAHPLQVEGTEQVVWQSRPTLAADPISPEAVVRTTEKIKDGMARKAVTDAATSAVAGEARTVPLNAFVTMAVNMAGPRAGYDIKQRIVKVLDTPGRLRDSLLVEGGRVALRPRDDRERFLEELRAN